MFFVRRAHAKVREAETPSTREPLLPKCYDEFKGTKIHNIIENPLPEGDRIYMRVPYACSAAAKERGGRWDPDAKRWWHCSNSTAQLIYHDDPDRWVDVLVDVHAQSNFAQWPMDVDFMRGQKEGCLSLPDTFAYRNPRA
jgi:hypothetical protein